MIPLVLAALAVSMGADGVASRSDVILKRIQSGEWDDPSEIPLPLLGRGSDRAVFFLPDQRVLKLANTPWGREQNLTEADIWQRLEGHPYADYLFAVIDFDPDGHWLVAERAVGQPSVDDARKFEAEVKRAFRSTLEWLPSDLRRPNMGIDVHGNVKALDYGTWIVSKHARRPFVLR